MKKNIWIIVCILWTIWVIHDMYSDLWHVRDDSTYTTINDTVYDSYSDKVYVTDNVDHSGFIYAIGPDNKVEAIFSSDVYAEETFCDELLYKGGELYALIFGKTRKENQPVKAYSIIQLDPESLKPIAHSNWFKTYDGGEVKYISKDDNNFYITELSSDDKQARVYAIPTDVMTEVAKGDDNNIRNVATIRYSLATEPTDGYYFVYAGYENGELTTMENGNGLIDDSVFDEYAAERFEHKIFSPGQIILINRHLIRMFLLIWLAGILFVLALTFFVKQRNRVAYMIIIWEVMLVIVFLFTILRLSDWNQKTDWDEVLKFVSFTVDDVRSDLDELEAQFENTEHYYRSDDFKNINERLRDVVSNYGNGEVFVNLLSITILNDEEYHVIASAKGFDNCDLVRLYGDEAFELAKFVHEYGIRDTSRVQIDGVDYSLICVGKKEEAHPTSMLMAVIDQSGSDDVAFTQIAFAVLTVAAFFILASILGIAILLRQAKDLRLLGNTMMDVSQGGVGIKKPETLGEDMSDMWSGLMDIDRSFKNLNYIKYRTFEAYYKFAPKSVERLMDKTSITEVNSGDFVKKNGTIILVDANANSILLGLSKFVDSMDRINVSNRAGEILALLSKYQDENIAYKISVTSDMTEMDMVMPENATKACDVGVELSKTYGRVGYSVCIFMHYTNYIYGVSIAGDEANQYLISGDIVQIKGKLKILNELRLSMVITGSVLERELDKPSNRYIGYWNLGGGEKIELYEVLDALSDENRQMREETRKLFEEGLELFYEGTYYLARNSFAKVIKRDHSDSVARWYLFTCEKYLDGTLKVANFELSE